MALDLDQWEYKVNFASYYSVYHALAKSITSHLEQTEGREKANLCLSLT